MVDEYVIDSMRGYGDLVSVHQIDEGAEATQLANTIDDRSLKGVETHLLKLHPDTDSRAYITKMKPESVTTVVELVKRQIETDKEHGVQAQIILGFNLRNPNTNIFQWASLMGDLKDLESNTVDSFIPDIAIVIPKGFNFFGGIGTELINGVISKFGNVKVVNTPKEAIQLLRGEE
jgi:hypothetical protein